MEMRSLAKLLWVGLLSAAFVGTASAADPEVEQLLSKMRAAYSAVKSVQITTSSVFHRPQESKVQVVTSFVRPNKIYSSMIGLPGTRPGTKVALYTDGKKVQMRGHPNGDVERPYTLQSYLTGLAANLETICFWDYTRQLSTAKGANMHDSKLKIVKGVAWNGRSWTVLEEQAQGVFVRYFIDPNTSFINRTIVTNNAAKKVVAEHIIQKIDTAAKIDPKIFVIRKISKDRVDI